MAGHSGQKCNVIATCILLDRVRVPLDRTSIPLDRGFLPFDRTSIILSLAILYWFIPLAFHIYPCLRGNSILSDRNYRSAKVTIWSAVKRGRLNLDLVFVWRHTIEWKHDPME